MRVVALSDKLVGESLAMPVHGDGGRLMLAQGMKLTPALITALRSRGYTRVAVEDSLMEDVVIDESIREETRRMTIAAMDTATKNILRGTRGDLNRLETPSTTSSLTSVQSLGLHRPLFSVLLR